MAKRQNIGLYSLIDDFPLYCAALLMICPSTGTRLVVVIIIIIQKTSRAPTSSDNQSSVAQQNKIILESQIHLQIPSRQQVVENARALRRISEMGPSVTMRDGGIRIRGILISTYQRYEGVWSKVISITREWRCPISRKNIM